MGFLSNVGTMIAGHAADLGAHTMNTLEVLKTGNYLNYWGQYASTSATIVAAGKLYATCPLLVARPLTIDRLACNVKVAGAAGERARLGVYRNGNNCYPGALLLDAGEISVDSTGVKKVDIDLALARGLYWMAFVCDGTPEMIHTYNAPSPLGVRESDLSYRYHMVYQTGFGYGALPDPFPAGGIDAADASPAVFARLASLD